MDIYLDGPEGLAEFNRDPDGYAAALFDLSRDEYREWVTLHGTPLCGCMTKAGRPCSLAAATGRGKLEAEAPPHRLPLSRAQRLSGGKP